MRIQDDFWSNVKEDSVTGCWNWLRCVNSSGYGSLKVNGITTLAHRYAYYRAVGPLQLHINGVNKPDTELVLHSCDNRLCCDPAHLRTGTNHDNQKEAYARKRKTQPKGSLHVNSKLNNADIKNIRSAHTKGMTQVSLAAIYHVSQHCISLITRKETYTNVT